jgi:hypothetical protein
MAMKTRLILAALLAAGVTSAAADDPTLADLSKAKAAHAKELARLRDKLLADIDAVIKAENDRGAVINYMLKERKGFAENGVTPILPKLLPASGKYLEGKKAADAELESAYTRAVEASVKAEKVDQAIALRTELKNFRGASVSLAPESDQRKAGDVAPKKTAGLQPAPDGPPRLPGGKPDPIRAALDEAWVAYRADVSKADQAVTDSLEQAETRARQKGDKPVVDRVKAERIDFLLTGVLPRWAPAGVQPKYANARHALESAYRQAVKAYTRASEDEKATAVQKEFEEFLKQPPPRYFTLVNEKSGLVLAPAKATAERASFLIQSSEGGEPYQQWSFVPAGTPGVYLIKNRLSGLYVNICGSHEVGGPTALWSFDAAEHNHWSITPEGKHLRIRDANGNGYMAPDAGSTDTGKSIVKAAKQDGDEQLWRLVPVKTK